MFYQLQSTYNIVLISGEQHFDTDWWNFVWGEKVIECDFEIYNPNIFFYVIHCFRFILVVKSTKINFDLYFY